MSYQPALLKKTERPEALFDCFPSQNTDELLVEEAPGTISPIWTSFFFVRCV